MPHRPARPALRQLSLLAAFAVPVVLLSGIAATISAKPPSSPSPVPREVFRPVAMPSDPPVPAVAATADPVPEARLWRRIAGPTPTPQPAAPAGPVHVVRSGDTLWQIAAWHRADLELILRWNPDVEPRRLVAGQRILVPGGRPMPSRLVASTADVRTLATAARSGEHLWPLPVRGWITTRFSAVHPGIDIATRTGTAVRAIAPGRVTWAGWKDNGGGYVVVIRHPDGMVSTYNHNRAVTVRVGQVVASGEQIAAVGATGWATGPHLDLRIRMGGRLIDPLRLAWTR